MLTIPLQTVGWIIVKGREFDVKTADVSDGDDQDGAAEVLLDRGGDPTASELTSWIDDLTNTQAAELVALMWLGRGDGDAEEFPALVEQARRARSGRTSAYLLGEPLLADYLESGLEALDIDVSEVESNLR
jgi:hypothetical protein